MQPLGPRHALIILAAAIGCHSITLASEPPGFSGGATAEDVLLRYLSVSEGVIIGNVQSISTIIDRAPDSGAAGIPVELYKIKIGEILAGSSEYQVGSIINLHSLGGNANPASPSNISGNGENRIKSHFRSVHINGWPKIHKHGKHLIFIESTRRGRSVLPGEAKYLVKGYELLNSSGATYINIINNDLSSKKGRGTNARIYIHDIRSAIANTIHEIDTFDYDQPMSSSGMRAID